MELQNYFAQVGIRKKVKDVAKYIAEEVRPDERDEALFAIFLEVEDILKKRVTHFHPNSPVLNC